MTSANIPSSSTCKLQKKINGTWVNQSGSFARNQTYQHSAAAVGAGTYEYKFKCGTKESDIATLTVTAAPAVASANIGFDANYTKTKTITLSPGQIAVPPSFYLTSATIPGGITCYLQKKRGGDDIWDNQLAFTGNTSYTSTTHGGFVVGPGIYKYRYACGSVISQVATLTVNPGPAFVNIGFDANYTKTKAQQVAAGQSVTPTFYVTSENIAFGTVCYLQKKINGIWVNQNGFNNNTPWTYSNASPVGVGIHEYQYKCGTVTSQKATLTVTAS